MPEKVPIAASVARTAVAVSNRLGKGRCLNCNGTEMYDARAARWYSCFMFPAFPTVEGRYDHKITAFKVTIPGSQYQ